MARKKSKQQGVAQKELVPGQQTVPKNPVSPGDATGGDGGGEDAGDRLNTTRANQVPLSHSSSCKFQGCGNGYPEQSTVDWDPSSFLSAHKLSGLWNSAHTNGGDHCNHNAPLHIQQGITAGSACQEKRGLHEAPGKSAKAPIAKVCPYSHPLTQNSSGSTAGTPLSTSTDLCKTTPKHFKNVCRRPTPPGEAFHTSDHHLHTDLSVPPNSPTGLSSQHTSRLPPKSNSGQHNHVTSSSANAVAGHTPFSPLVPNLHGSTAKRASCSPESPTLAHKSSPCKNPHIPPVNTQHSKSGTPVAGCNHSCNGHSTGSVPSTNVGNVSAGACRDQACKGHKWTALEIEEVEDEDSSSERSSCASSSTNQKDGKYCDCCYCEFFGHNAPPAAPTSRNYAEIREKLRSRLTRRKEELPQRQDSELTGSGAIDNRDVDELLDFINSSEPKPVNSAKAAKRARHKQKKKEKALQSNATTTASDPLSNPSECIDEPMPDTAEASRLLDWPQLELERVNSFLTSRLEEIKNTIKDSIRASFSMYDLNLDVNDFPKKAATLEGNHLLSHLNGSSDLQQIDLDLAPLSLGTFKNHLDIVNGWEDTNTQNTATTTTATAPATALSGGSKDIQRLNTTPSLSKLIRVRSPEKCTSSASDSPPQVPAQVTAKSKEDISDPKNSTIGNGGTKSKKSKKQQQKLEPSFTEHNSKVTESKMTEIICNGSKVALKQVHQPVDNQRNGLKKAEDSRSSRNSAANGANVGPSNSHKIKGDTEMRAVRCEQEFESKSHLAILTNGQHQVQSKGKNKKNKNKGEKSTGAIDDVFLPKDVDPTEMDETDREVEYFKRFCLDSAKQTRRKVAVNWSNFSLKKVPSNAAQ
ncbi:protein FAM193B isoform X2 [Corythoichthys intestinalis]|uniref:protein FAM193B isoform X2 n=1 Tax=Corythoichthys intestinalis TaxID=161448 RepID=UPI0025A4CC87|nr:protein FAM193B isoform X2 [Corythoichthys intestinalis]